MQKTVLKTVAVVFLAHSAIFSFFCGFSLILPIFQHFLAHKIKNMAYFMVVLGIANVLNNFEDFTRGIIAKLGDFQIIFCGFSLIFTIFALL